MPKSMKGGDEIVVTISKRDAKYCNIKFVLIFLVVYGHVIESGMNASSVIQKIYKGIYLVHMPVFVFLSGYFVNSISTCRQMLRKYIKLYIVIQGMMVLISYVNDRCHFISLNTMHPINHCDFFIPYWHLWYLLSLCEWIIIAMVWFWIEKRIQKNNIKIQMVYQSFCIMICVLLGCLIGYSDMAGRFLSLSRTIVYLPYFLSGLFLKKDINWKKYQIPAFFSLALAVFLCVKLIKILPYQFLWMVYPYHKMEIESGSIYRLLCYLAGGLSVFSMLALIPEKRTRLSVIGADTFPVYLVHPYIILAMQGMNCKMGVVYDTESYFEIVGGIVSVFGILFVIYKWNQWNKKLCYVH